jgi:hypothetical protein
MTPAPATKTCQKPNSDSDTITVNTDKNKEKRKLQNQYALLSDDEASFLSHPATHRQNTHERRANEKQATKERNRGVDNITYGASLSAARKNKSYSPPLQLSNRLKPRKEKTQSTLFPFV